ncbi:uncharacterized protein LOC126777335 [Nymphalis io]|uniref:uncharacterized protein LOC126777335 n=1 Tax=Inachis io TaxID=171585 RepID=UPI002166C76F|nr:uncharacterized protein LOC126777335 [Nymphalis io]
MDTELSSDAFAGRKRPRVGLGIFDSGSDTETEGRVTAKCNSARRGKPTSKGRGTVLTRAKAELKAKAAEAREEAFERSLRSRAFRKNATEVVLDSDESSSSDVRREDPIKLGAEELRAEAGRNAALILEVAQKSGNLKSGFIKKLKDLAASLQCIVDALASRTEAEETRRLRADNGRLRKEIDDLKTELKAHRREFTEMRTSVAAANGSGTSPLQDLKALEEFRASIVSSVGVMINAKLAGIEERLLPVKIHRPPLAADIRRDAMQETAPTYAQATRPVPPKNAAAVPKHVHPSAPSKPAASVAPATPIAGPSNISTAPEFQPREAQETSWSTVVKRGKKGKKASPPAEISAPVISAVTKTQAAKPKLTAPRTAAVIVTLQPEAEEKGVTYAQVLERAEQGIKLQDLGICSGLKIRRSATGARVLELPKAQSEQAEKLAEKLRTVLDGVANVVRPIKRVDLKVTGLDDSVTPEKLVAAVARAGDCTPEAVKCGALQRGPGYMGMVRITCPITVAKKLSDAGRLLVGWSSAKVYVLEQRPLRCYKCMGVGHTKMLCPSKAERGGLCFRCGIEGHKSSTCTGKLHCAVCADAGRPSGHVMGSGECNPPFTKGKMVLGTHTITNVGRRQAEEEAPMST